MLNPLYEEHFSTMTMEEVSAEAQRRGIVCTPVLTPADVLANEHFASRDTFMDVEVADGVQGRMPSGFWEIDGQRQGPRGPVPTIGQHTAEVYADNMGGTFNGNHLMAPDVVAGTLLSNRPVRPGAHALEDLTVEILRQYGIQPLPGQRAHPVLE